MLSILIPTYNYNVLPLVQELHKQASKAGITFEIIVLDDASDNTFPLNIEIAANVIFIKNEINLGRTRTRAILAEKAKYNTLLFLDADVMPKSENFIAKHIPYINSGILVFGGYSYTGEFDIKHVLRHKYGKSREEKSASIRSKHPYSSIFSGNILCTKNIFINNNPTGNGYGMDVVFCYNLYKNNIEVKHIDNPILHLGLEDNKTFFSKCREAVRIRKKILENAEGSENINSLLRHYKTLKKYKLTGLAHLLFTLSEPLLKRMILKKDPNLFCLDIYRLGYICSIK